MVKEMPKILFVPTNSREVMQFSLVRHALEADYKCHILAIAMDAGMEALLRQKKFSYKHLADYKTMNMLNIIKVEKPDVVVTDFCGFIPRALIYAANHANVSCFQVDDGITTDYSALRDIPLRQSLSKIMRGITRVIAFKATAQAVSWLLALLVTLMAINNPLHCLRKIMMEIWRFTYPVPSYIEGLNIAVVSPFAKEAYKSMGAPPEKIFVTGQPGFDLMFSEKLDKDRFLSELGIPPSKCIAVLATQPLVRSLWSKDDRKMFIKAVVRAMDNFPHEQLIIKLHPDEDIEDYHGLLEEISYSKAIVCQDIDLYEILNACNLLMTVHSTVALEAMLFNKPVICIDLTGRCFTSFYTESGAAIGVYREEDLIPAIQKTLYDPQFRDEQEQNRKKFINKHIYKPDGQASKRVADLIMQMIEESRKAKGET